MISPPSPGWFLRALFEDDHHLGADLRSVLFSPEYSQSVPHGAVVAAILGILLIATTLVAERGFRHASTNTDGKSSSADYVSPAAAAPAETNLPSAPLDSGVQAYSGIDSLSDQRDYTLAMLDALSATEANQSSVAQNGSGGGSGQSGAGLAGSHISGAGFGGGGPQSQQTGSTTVSTTAVPEGGSALLFLTAALATMVAGQRVISRRFRQHRQVR